MGKGFTAGLVSRRAPSVLVVESTREDRAMYAQYLRLRGFHAIEIDNTGDALALSTTADVIVTGVRVGGPFDGIEFVRRLRDCSGPSGKPIIVLATCAFERDQMRAQAAGCDAFLLKPCLPDALVSEICRVLALSGGPWAAK